MIRQFDTLCFSPGESGRRLTHPKISESDIVEHLEFVHHSPSVSKLSEEGNRFRHRHRKDLIDILAMISDLQHLLFEALSFTRLTSQIEVGQELHLDLLKAVPLTEIAPATRNVEGEIPRQVSSDLGGLRVCQEVANEIERFDVGNRIRPRRATDGRLIDQLDAVDMLQAFHRSMLADVPLVAAFRLLNACIEDFVDERALARPAHAGDANEESKRDANIKALQVVLGCPFDEERLFSILSALRWNRDGESSAKILSRQ